MCPLRLVSSLVSTVVESFSPPFPFVASYVSKVGILLPLSAHWDCGFCVSSSSSSSRIPAPWPASPQSKVRSHTYARSVLSGNSESDCKSLFHPTPASLRPGWVLFIFLFSVSLLPFPFIASFVGSTTDTISFSLPPLLPLFLSFPPPSLCEPILVVAVPEGQRGRGYKQGCIVTKGSRELCA